jgi:tRNA-specific 2-thiouridylase
VKFGALLSHAREVGADRVATGHYARIRRHQDRSRSLHVARDVSKDQSYFLFELSQEQLSRAEFPVGDLSKGEVREIAHDLGLAVADKPESQDICFVPQGDYRAVIRSEWGNLGQTGRIETKEGRLLGTHGGVASYTVGQRRGLGVPTDERLYVLQVDAGSGTVVVGADRDLNVAGLTASRWHWISGRQPRGPVEGSLRIRYGHPGAEAVVEPLAEGSASGNGRGAVVRARFATPQRAVAPGQAAVLYRDGEVVGGGWLAGPVP